MEQIVTPFGYALMWFKTTMFVVGIYFSIVFIKVNTVGSAQIELPNAEAQMPEMVAKPMRKHHR